jgi:hypothetical protein
MPNDICIVDTGTGCFFYVTQMRLADHWEFEVAELNKALGYDTY